MIEKLLKFQNLFKPSTDKVDHLYFGFLYTVLGYILYLIFGLISLIAIPSILLGLIKELRDLNGYGKPEFLDFIFTIIPCSFTLIVMYLELC